MPNFENYHVQEELGRAARSNFFRALRIRDGREVILKEYVIPPDKAVEFRAKYVARYCDECMWLEQIHHPNIIDVVEVIQPTAEHITPILIMEAMEISLSRMMEEHRRFGHQEVISWMVQILTGVKAFHAKQIVHRDLKPSNIMFRNGVPKIIDLGIAVKVGQEITLSSDDISAQYAAPEMYRGQAGANFATDIYSVGFLAYQLLCGEDRFAEEFEAVISDDARQSLLRWINWHNDPESRLRPLHEIVPEIPEYISLVLDRMTAKDLRDRYQTVSDVLEDLFLQSRGHNDAFSLIIKDCVTADYWRNPDLYKITDDIIGGFSSSGTGLGDDPAPPKPSSRKKLALVGVLVVVWAVLGVFGYRFYKDKQYEASLLKHWQETLAFYDASKYDDTKTNCNGGIDYIRELKREKKFARFTELYGLGIHDSDWVVGLDAKLDQAEADRDAGRLEPSKVAAEEVAAQEYQREGRDDGLDALTQAKIDELKARAKALLEALTGLFAEAESVRRDAEAAMAAGKYRQAFYLIMTSAVGRAAYEDLLAKAEPVVQKLEAGRSAIDSKKAAGAVAAFEDAWRRSDRKSVEAGYYLIEANLDVMGSLEPRALLDSLKPLPEDSLERRVLSTMIEMTALSIEITDFEQDAKAAELKGLYKSSLELVDELKERAAQTKETNPRLYDAKSIEGMKYPVEESRSYYQNILVDLQVLRLHMAILFMDYGAADDLLASVKEAMLAADHTYYQAHLKADRAITALRSRSPVEPVPAGSQEALQNARQTFEGLLADHPDWASCHMTLGFTLMALQETDAAMREAKQAITVLGENKRLRRAGAKLAIDAAVMAHGEKDPAKLRAYCDQAEEFWEDYPLAWLLRAYARTLDPAQTAEATAEYLAKFDSAYKTNKYPDAQLAAWYNQLSKIRVELLGK